MTFVSRESPWKLFAVPSNAKMIVFPGPDRLSVDVGKVICNKYGNGKTYTAGNNLSRCRKKMRKPHRKQFSREFWVNDSQRRNWCWIVKYDGRNHERIILLRYIGRHRHCLDRVENLSFKWKRKSRTGAQVSLSYSSIFEAWPSVPR